jgi:hypothetical protein
LDQLLDTMELCRWIKLLLENSENYSKYCGECMAKVMISYWDIIGVKARVDVVVSNRNGN